jgi:hypothetical protein
MVKKSIPRLTTPIRERIYTAQKKTKKTVVRREMPWHWRPPLVINLRRHHPKLSVVMLHVVPSRAYCSLPLALVK